MVGLFQKFCVIFVSFLLVSGVTVFSYSVMLVEGYAPESANTKFLSGSQDDLLYSVFQAGDGVCVSAGYTKCMVLEALTCGLLRRMRTGLQSGT